MSPLRSMSPLPDVIIAVLAPVAGVFSSAVWGHTQVLMIGAILCQGPRTVATILRVMGLGQDPRFERYHRVLRNLVRIVDPVTPAAVGAADSGRMTPWSDVGEKK